MRYSPYLESQEEDAVGHKRKMTSRLVDSMELSLLYLEYCLVV